jgi:signal transduction histidine kinase
MAEHPLADGKAPVASPSVAQVRFSERLYVRIYLALLLSLALTAGLFFTAWHFNTDPAQVGPSLETFAEFAAEILPPSTAPDAVQQEALAHWQPRVRSDLALYAADGRRIAAAGRPLPPLDAQQTASGWLGGAPPVFALKLPDGRWLVGQRIRTERRARPNLTAAALLIALAVAVGAYPVVRRLTRRLERLQASVEALGAGQLSARVELRGDDEVARLAGSFNRSAARIEALVGAQKSLLANASHELRSPLARIRMAIALLETAPQEELQQELARNVQELDQLIDEILLASRLDAAGSTPLAAERLDLTALLADECARAGATLAAPLIEIDGEPKLLRRMIRNLLDNARRHGGGAIDAVLVTCDERTLPGVMLTISDAGPGVAQAQRENIFTPFHRLPGARERDGSIGLGLALVRQIARRHGGDAVCTARADGLPGSTFRIFLPQQQAVRTSL